MVAVHRTGKEVTELGGQGVQPGERAVVDGDVAGVVNPDVLTLTRLRPEDLPFPTVTAAETPG
ncbi:MAG: hypothetical protein ACJ736_24970 [Streptomyces sp.]